MWKFEHKLSIQLLTHLVEQDNGKKNHPILLKLLKKHGHIQKIQYLPQILNLQQKLVSFFQYKDLQKWREVSIEEFRKSLDEDEAPAFSEHVRILLKIWDYLQESHERIPDNLEHRTTENLNILDLLPSDQSITRWITEFLIKTQNDCISSAETQGNGEIKTEEMKPFHVIICNPEEDFLQIAISNTDYAFNDDGTQSTNYNFKTLENLLVKRFITDKPCINLTTMPSFDLNPMKGVHFFFNNSKDNLEPLNTDNKNYIMNEFKNLDEISEALSTLKITIGFLELSFGDPDMLLVDYMKKELRMEDGARRLSLPVLQSSRVKHIQSLWEVLSARRSMILVQMKQNPFYMIDEQFHIRLTETDMNELASQLSRFRNIDLFITELHDMIMNMEMNEIKPVWTIMETFTGFLERKEMHDECIKRLLNPLRELGDLKMENIIALWKLVVERRTA
ncbi:E3 ubiquitin-protein ligase rnf213-alpha-like [Brienomyrus brachyistius]|uniref:E3 ubiquitin-protein ligase rnf213-alpha-like n=1 Tax=Brienomyrus brachyistius TaxID=42636 RepID=UPI0020B2A6C7|nr:E3 ubiquitin-protein ligase rnf213-alpha-like [Brienomyrus brachyistius]